MVKVSVIMPVYNAEKFLSDSINSILNQSLEDIELICVDDGSSDDSLNILYDFENKDNRVKIFSLNHQGGGNARNYALNHISGEYLYIMDADDILVTNAFQKFYSISKSKNLDFLIFKAINYDFENDFFYETNYYNMPKLSEYVKDDVFDFNKIGKLIFNINVTPWCKFYKSEFILNSGAKFRENSKFHDNQFFWDIIFYAKRILFLDEFYYIRTRHSESLTGSHDKNHINIIGVVNDIIKLFIKHNQLENFKTILYNRKVSWIIDRYNEIQDKYKELFYVELKKDFVSIENSDFVENLWSNNHFIFDCVISSKNYNDLDLSLNFLKIWDDKILSINDKVFQVECWFNSLDMQYRSIFFNYIKSKFKMIDRNELTALNSLFYDNIINSATFVDFKSNNTYNLKNNLDALFNIKSNNDYNSEITQIYDNIISDLIRISDKNMISSSKSTESNLKYDKINDLIPNFAKDIDDYLYVDENLELLDDDLTQDIQNLRSLNILKDNLISDLSGKFDELNSKLADYNSIIDNRDDLLLCLNEDISDCRSIIENNNDTILNLNSEVFNYKGILSNQDDVILDLKRNIRKYEIIIDNKNDLISDLNSKINDFQDYIRKHSLELHRLESDNDYLRKKNKYLNQNILQLKSKNKSFFSNVKNKL